MGGLTYEDVCCGVRNITAYRYFDGVPWRLKQPLNGAINRRIMLFDLSIRGHHPNYIRQLLQYWNDNAVPGCLEVVVSPKFLEEHSDIINFANNLERQDFRFTAISLQEEAGLNSRKSFISRAKRAFQEIKLLAKYAKMLKATHCLIMYFDTFQLPLAMGVQIPCPFSGIYFRPTFHYREFPGYQSSWRRRLQQGWENLILTKTLKHSRCHSLFCLDPFAAKYLQKQGEPQVVYLPDPVTLPSIADVQVRTLETSLGIEAGRRVFLLFGSLTERKGIYEVLDAVAKLSPDLSQQLCLLLVGEISQTEKQIVEAKIAAIAQALPVQIITHYEFIPDETVSAYFDLADVVLAPYQQHVGMSGILLLAAAAQKPVLSSDYGLMGELVRSYELGIALDTRVPGEITRGLVRFLTEFPETFGDRQKMRLFAEQNTSDHYARVIFENL